MDWSFPVRPGRNDRQNAAHEQVLAEPVAIVTFVREQRFGLWQWQGHEVIGSSVIRCLAAGQDEADKQSLIVATGVDFARKAAA